ncbi:MAG: class I SAM-dependent DNA methyltransferase, partial [Abitibacteriaceae bacterium]|nr:class I SAM-dependent DNA methyltransferase [Abditibacteriaceae bacterium]
MTDMNVQEFVRKWADNQRSEKSASQEQFLDLCRLFEHPTPNEDATGEEFAFEKGAERIGGKSGQGWADVWKRHCFAWEYKGAHANLEAALKQLLQYRGNLDNPPLLVVSDMKRFVIHTNWTNTPDKRIEITLEDLKSPAHFEQLRNVFHHPERLKPDRKIDEITQEVAARFAAIALSMSGTREEPGRFEPLRVARFLDRVVFTLFAEDVDLLPDRCFERICTGDKTRYNPARFAAQLRQLWDAMAEGGDFGPYPIRHFNGGLFEDVEVLEPLQTELDALREAARTDWRNVDASIFGTLFERALDPDKRAQLGAHYTSRQDIQDLLEPVLLRPLREEWNALRDRLTPLLDDPTPRDQIAAQVNAFGARLAALRVLDPACGSGNFLYIALQSLKDLEQSVRVWARDANLREDFAPITPANFRGLELNVYAHDLAATTLQIGWLQWLKRNGAPTLPEPILQAPVKIENRDALLDLSDPAAPRETAWPECDVIVGNPPFLGGSRLWRELGREYQQALWQVYEGRVPGGADLCCYWFEKARAHIQKGA